MPTYTKYILFIGAIALAGCDNNVRFSSILSPGLSNHRVESAPAPGPLPVDKEKSEPTPRAPPVRSVILSPYVNAVAFEDLYSRKEHINSRPDFDYNDFLTNFKVQEFVNGENNITDIIIDFYPRAVGAGFDHVFYLILTGVKTTPSKNRDSLPVTKPMFTGPAHVTISSFDANGNQVGETNEIPYDQDIVVYPSTHAIFAPAHVSPIFELSGSFPVFNTATAPNGEPANFRVCNRNARIHISLDRPEMNPHSAEGFDPATFRVILHPMKTDYDIDIINVDSANFVGSSGYPWGFIIPTDWRWMKEGVQIDKGYPLFKEYRNFLTGRAADGDYMNWYNYPDGTESLYPNVPWRESIPPVSKPN